MSLTGGGGGDIDSLANYIVYGKIRIFSINLGSKMWGGAESRSCGVAGSDTSKTIRFAYARYKYLSNI
jgi:hypothetical protein